jgi:hypothetical protein
MAVVMGSKEMRREEKKMKMGKKMKKLGFLPFLSHLGRYFENINRDIGSPDIKFISAEILTIFTVKPQPRINPIVFA